MDEKNLRKFLHDIQVSTAKSTYSGSRKRTRWLTISCPFAPWTHQKRSDQNPSFGITINDEGRSYYKCLSCGMKGAVPTLASKLGGYRKRDYKKQRLWAEQVEMQIAVARPVPDWEETPFREQEAERDHNIPDPHQIDAYNRLYAHPYLSGRGVTYPHTALLGLRMDIQQRRILFPCYDEQDRFRGFTGRSVLPADAYTRRYPKIKDYLGLNKRELFLCLPSWVRSRKTSPTILVEGLFDYARLVSLGYTSTMAILGTALTEEKIDILIARQNPVVFFMDNDLAGWQAVFGVKNEDDEFDTSNAWAFRLYQEIPVWIVPYRSRLLKGEDPGSLPAEDIHKGIEKAWLFTGKQACDELGVPGFRRPR